MGEPPACINSPIFFCNDFLSDVLRIVNFSVFLTVLPLRYHSVVKTSTYMLASFPTVQFLIAYSMQKQRGKVCMKYAINFV